MELTSKVIFNSFIIIGFIIFIVFLIKEMKDEDNNNQYRIMKKENEETFDKYEKGVPINKKELLGGIIKDTEALKYKLTRSADKLIYKSKNIKWITFDNNNRFCEEFTDIAIGRTLLMSPFTQYFTWMTTEVVEIISNEEVGCIFKTKNNIYTLIKI